MTIKEAQEQVDKWIKSVGVRYFSELTNMAILLSLIHISEPTRPY